MGDTFFGKANIGYPIILSLLISGLPSCSVFFSFEEHLYETGKTVYVSKPG